MYAVQNDSEIDDFEYCLPIENLRIDKISDCIGYIERYKELNKNSRISFKGGAHKLHFKYKEDYNLIRLLFVTE